jgi:D-alanyl-D-alanine endopeptidase (penicillin-binding protein 7)
MLQNLLSVMAVMSLAPAPSPKLDPVYIYGQSMPIQPALVAQAPSRELEVRPILPPKKKNPKNLGVATSGKSVFVADVASGGIMYAKAPHDVHPIASITKLMTALVLMESEKKLNGDLTFIESDFDHESKPIFEAGDTISRNDAMRALLVGSVNAAGNALARTSGLSREEFIARMNQKAEELNLNSMNFVEPTGLKSGNCGDAADVAALITIALRDSVIRGILDEPEVSLKTKAGKDYKVESTNLLLTSYLNKSPYKIVGAKTGSLPEAGYCMAQVTKDDKGHEVVAVLLGSDNHFSRYRDIKSLTGWAFNSFDWSN